MPQRIGPLECSISRKAALRGRLHPALPVEGATRAPVIAPWQYSVFFCGLREIDRVRLQSDLEAEMHLREDQVIILDLGANEEGIREGVTVIGQSLPEMDSGMVVI